MFINRDTGSSPPPIYAGDGSVPPNQPTRLIPKLKREWDRVFNGNPITELRFP